MKWIDQWLPPFEYPSEEEVIDLMQPKHHWTLQEFSEYIGDWIKFLFWPVIIVLLLVWIF